MKNQQLIKYLLPLILNLTIPIYSIISTKDFHLQLDPLFLSIIVTLYLIPTLLYFLFFFTIGFLFKVVLHRVLVSISLSYFIIGQVFKLMHWPGGTILSLLGSIITVSLIVYLIIDRFRKNQTKSAQNE
jgi:hypothetical protein